MKKILITGGLLLALVCNGDAQTKKISKAALKDKIRGGWAGQTIGVTFGGPTEFKFNGTFIQDYQPIPWYDGYLKKTMESWPDLYDDIYMDLTFVNVLDRVGLDAPIDSFAHAFAFAGYNLWHANQAARYNIANGISAPMSGHWLHNPHADDIDYQIESDFAGLMHPGMPNSASVLSDKVGHIMNYGDGWYGGVYMGAMYTLAFVSDDMQYVVTEALKTIPVQSSFYQCMNDVIKWHKQYPDDWKQTWFELQRKWAEDVGCPDGVFSPFNIDARINAAYVLLGLLYGEGDYGKTLEIATRAGQDSDCNPSSAAGILGAMIGYDRIPAHWKMGLKEIEDMDFKYTTMSLNKVYDISYRHALEMITRNGGKVTARHVEIKTQQPVPVRLEKSFEGHTPVAKLDIHKDVNPSLSFEFEGNGFALRGAAMKHNNAVDFVLEAELYVDDVKVETAKFPTAFHDRRHDLFWKYQLPEGRHRVKIVWLNPREGYSLRAWECVAYSGKK